MSMDQQREQSTSSRRPIEEVECTRTPDNKSPNNDDCKNSSDLSTVSEWSYNEETGALLHTSACSICGEWRVHHDSCRNRESLIGAHDACDAHFRDEVAEPRIKALTEERDRLCHETAALKQELDAVVLETEQIQRDQKKKMLDDKQARQELRDRLRGSITPLSNDPPTTSSQRPPKRRRTENVDPQVASCSFWTPSSSR